MKTLKLPRLRGMQNSIMKEKIPFSAMWSESLLPRPQDWPEQCRVVGTCRFNLNNSQEKAFDPIQAGLQDFIQWLECGPKPIFIGFGSMMIEHPERIANMIMIAHTLTGALKAVAFLGYLAELDPCNSVLMEVFNVLIRNVYQESSVKEIETVLAIQSVLKDYALIDVKTKVTVESFKTV